MLPRVPRWMQLARDAAYHVLSRGHNRGALCAGPDDHSYSAGPAGPLPPPLRRPAVPLLLHLDDPRRCFFGENC